MARPLGRDHDHVVASRRCDLPEVDAETVREEQGGSGLEVRRHLVLVDMLLRVIGQEDSDQLRVADHGRNRLDGQSRVLRGRPRLAADPEADLYVHARVAQVEGMRMPLTSVAEDRHLPREEIAVAFAVNGCH